MKTYIAECVHISVKKQKELKSYITRYRGLFVEIIKFQHGQALWNFNDISLFGIEWFANYQAFIKLDHLLTSITKYCSSSTFIFF